jgi:hypothetical protein
MSKLRQAVPLCRPVEAASDRRLRDGVEELAIGVRGALGRGFPQKGVWRPPAHRLMFVVILPMT